MRRVGALFALLAAAVVLLVIRNGLQQTPVPAPVETEAPQPAYRMLYERPLSGFEGMTVALDGGSYAVSSSMVHDANGALLGVTNMLGQPLTVDGRADFALDASAWQMMLVAAQNLPVTASYDALDLQACGLDNPAARVELRYADGETIRLSVGKKTSSGLSCYVQMEGDPAVHLVPSDFYDVITRTLPEQHALPGALRQTADNAGQVAVVGLDDQGAMIASRKGTDDQLLPWTVESPVQHSADTRRVEQLIEGICAIHAETYIATVYDAAGLAAYGLDQPVRLIASFYDGTIRDIHVGADAGDGMVYIRMDTTGDIYAVSRQQLDFSHRADLDSLLDRFVALVPIQQLAHAQIALTDRSILLEQRWQPEDENVASSYAIGGQTTDRQTFSSVYAKLIGLQFDKTADAGALPGKLKMDVRFVMRDGTETQLQVYAYNEHYDLIDAGAAGRFLIRCEKVDDLILAIKGESL